MINAAIHMPDDAIVVVTMINGLSTGYFGHISINELGIFPRNIENVIKIKEACEELIIKWETVK